MSLVISGLLFDLDGERKLGTVRSAPGKVVTSGDEVGWGKRSTK